MELHCLIMSNVSEFNIRSVVSVRRADVRIRFLVFLVSIGKSLNAHCLSLEIVDVVL